MVRAIIITLVRTFCYIVFRVKKVGENNIQKKGAYIMCANHTSNWDPPILVFPVKRGKMDLDSIKFSLKVLKEGEILMLFPEGTRNGIQKNGKAQNGAAFMALRTGIPVIPVGIQGEMKPFHKVKLNYGKPLDFSQYKTNKPEKELLDKVSKEIMDNIIMLTNEEI